MPTSTTIKIRYLDGTIETFTNCTVSSMPGDTSDYLTFVGTLAGDADPETHRIRIAAGMRFSVRTA